MSVKSRNSKINSTLSSIFNSVMLCLKMACFSLSSKWPGSMGQKEKWPREPELNSRKKPACWVRWPVYTMLFACEANLFTLFSNVTQKFYVKYNYMREKIRQKWLLPEYWSHACCKIEDVKLNSLTSKFCLTVYWNLFFLYFGKKKRMNQWGKRWKATQYYGNGLNAITLTTLNSI